MEKLSGGASVNVSDHYKMAVLVALQLANDLNKVQQTLDLSLSNAKRLNDLLENNL